MTYLKPPVKTALRYTSFLIVIALVSACSSKPSRYSLKHDTGPDRDIDHHAVKDAVPRDEPKSRGGNKNYRVLGKNYSVMSSSTGYKQRGIASWYGKKFHGHKTSNGEIYDMYKMSAAHKSLPLPTYVRVTHLKNGRSVILRVNDRGPFHRNRLIDLSYVAAKKLGIAATGTGVVEIEAINTKQSRAKSYSAYTTQQNSGYAATSKAGRFSNHPATINTHFEIYLQAGAFNQRNNAELLQKRILRLGLPYNTLVKFDNRLKLFKVQLGPFDRVSTADAASERLYKHYIENTYIIVD